MPHANSGERCVDERRPLSFSREHSHPLFDFTVAITDVARPLEIKNLNFLSRPQIKLQYKFVVLIDLYWHTMHVENAVMSRPVFLANFVKKFAAIQTVYCVANKGHNISKSLSGLPRELS